VSAAMDWTLRATMASAVRAPAMNVLRFIVWFCYAVTSSPLDHRVLDDELQ
jgi:hypothetical protein